MRVSVPVIDHLGLVSHILCLKKEWEIAKISVGDLQAYINAP